MYRRRAVAPGQTGNQNAGGVRAVACGTGPQGQAIDCAGQRAGPFEWEILEERKDYYVDPTGTWFALANRLDQNDHLAVSYITGTRTDTIGTFPVEVNRDTAVIDTLRLVYDPKPGITAAAPSFRFEIRNAYRVGGREVTRESMALALMVNQRERSPAGQPYLSVLGVALDNDPNQFDQYNRLFPRGRDPNQGDPVRDLFIIFPHLTPFADSTKLAPAERNDSLYRTPRSYLATQAPPSVFTLRLHVEASASDDRSVLSLNSFQIREGSERIYVGNILLVRDVKHPTCARSSRNALRSASRPGRSMVSPRATTSGPWGRSTSPACSRTSRAHSTARRWGSSHRPASSAACRRSSTSSRGG